MNAARLRRWFAIAAILMVMVVAGFYIYGRYRVRKAVRDVPNKLGIEIQQSAEGFTISKSEGDRTLFTIKAGKAVSFKQGGRAELHDVNIVVYGRREGRFDQIYGSRFEWDPQSGEARAIGEVHIDLEASAETTARPEQAPPRELHNPVHFKTSDLVFSRDTGIASTEKAVEFRIPQATGSAQGATYDSRSQRLVLHSDVRVKSRDAQVTAAKAVVTQQPLQGVLSDVRGRNPGGRFVAREVTVKLRADNSIEQVLATGGVEVGTSGGEAVEARAPQATFAFGAKSEILTAALHGGVQLHGSGASPVNGSAERIVAEFSDARMQRIRALNNVSFRQAEGPDTSELHSDAVTFFMRAGRTIDRAETSGHSEIVIAQAKAQTTTVATADQFTMRFDPRGRLRSLHGEPNARISSRAADQAERVSTSRQLDVAFTARGAVEHVAQQGGVEFKEGQRTATAERARYTPADGGLTLSGSPRVTEQGFEIAANGIRIDTDSSSATAEGDVRSTYTQVKPQPGGAMFAAAEPIHATAERMTAQRTPSVARYSGGVRIWQAASVLQAPQIEFDYEKRSLTAQGRDLAPVSTVFMAPAQDGALRPVNVTAQRLTYNDQQRLARFSGGVTVRGADATITAPAMEVHLAAQAQPAQGSPQAGQVARIVASGGVAIQQASRRATGERLTYTAAEGKFVLTGGPPRIEDAELGSITGDSLTFYTRDGRVQVASGTSSRTVTTTRVRQ